MNTLRKLVIAIGFGVLAGPPALAQLPGIIDTHGHIENGGRRGTDFRGSFNAALGRMDTSGIRRIIIMPPPMAAGTPGAYEIESYGSAIQA